MTAVAWRTSAGTAARIPVARVTNLVRALKGCAAAGLMVVGLDADGSMSLDSFDLGTGPLVLVVGAEGRGCRGWWRRPVTPRCRSRWPGRWSR